jgi:hypothetical protein
VVDVVPVAVVTASLVVMVVMITWWFSNICSFVNIFFDQRDSSQERGDISCQFLMPGGSIGPRYVLQLSFIEKSQNC